MCGIAGYFLLGKTTLVEGRQGLQQQLLTVRDRMMTRGPDGAGLWVSPDTRVGLAHRRLSILDLSDHAAQPMFTSEAEPERRLGIVFNGEIYNFRELRAELENKGHRFQSTGDTEVLLALYREYGPNMVERLRGMFAFAIHDAGRRELFLARDPMGIKPLYYSTGEETFHFASQVKALAAFEQIDRSPDPAGQASFYLWGSVAEPYTLYRGIRSLPAGSTMHLRADGTRTIAQYANVVAVLAEGLENPSEAQTPSDRAKVLHDALRETVSRHVISDVPVALFLSAGLDSATLLALMSEVPEWETRSLSLGFDITRGTADDETGPAESLAARYGAQHRSYYVNRDDFMHERESLLAAMDQPTIDGINTYFVSRMSRQAGFKVAISGLGGDEIFAGYPSFAQVPRMANALAPFSAIPGLGRIWRTVSTSALRRFTSPKYSGLIEYGGSYPGAYLLRRGLYMPWELPGVMGAEMAAAGLRELHPMLTMNELLRPLDGVSGPIAGRLRVSALEMSMYMRNQLLRDADWAGMAHSVEIRVPMVDYTLLRAIAPLLGSSHAPGKQQMAAAPLRPLPAEIMDRPKTGFSVPVREWLTSDSTLAHERGLRGWARLVIDAYMV